MSKVSDLEIALRRGSGDDGEVRAYSVEMRFRAPDSETEERLIRDGDATLRIDPNRFNLPINNWREYGQKLRDVFFCDWRIRPAFETALGRTPPDGSLRVRFYIEPGAVELQRVHWEAMADPDPNRPLPLFGNRRVMFSRYLNSGDCRQVQSRPGGERLKALIVVANPSDLAARGMTAIPQEPEVSRVVTAFGDQVEYSMLAATGRATRKNIVAELGKGVDIFYLVCHGQAMQRADGTWESVLCLEKDDGKLVREKGAEFVQQVQDLEARPRLIVLASCQSAGNAVEPDPDADSFVAAIGPKFAEAGIPAVLAMSGNLTVDTAKLFIPAFFRELLGEQGEGRIDRAVAVARGEAQERPDCWMPLLFTRLIDVGIRMRPGDSERWGPVEVGRDLHVEEVDGLTAIGVDAPAGAPVGEVSVLRGATIQRSSNLNLIGVRSSGATAAPPVNPAAPVTAPPATGTPVTVAPAARVPVPAPVVFDLPPEIEYFVGRAGEMDLFYEVMKTGNPPIMAVMGDSGLGKTTLVARMQHECALRRLPMAEITWTETRPYDYLAIMRKIRDSLNPVYFQGFTDLVNFFTTPKYELTIKLDGAGPIDVGRNAVLTDSKVDVMAGVYVKDLMIAAPRTDMDVPEAERKSRLTDRFLENLGAATADSTAVIFFDEVEKASETTRSWLWDELLSHRNRRRLSNLRFVLSGQVGPPPEMDRPQFVEKAPLPPLEDDEIEEYLRKRGLPEAECGAYANAFSLACATTAQLAAAVDKLIAKRRKLERRNG